MTLLILLILYLITFCASNFESNYFSTYAKESFLSFSIYIEFIIGRIVNELDSESVSLNENFLKFCY